jgi:hypothetical protein
MLIFTGVVWAASAKKHPLAYNQLAKQDFSASICFFFTLSARSLGGESA